MPTFEEPIWLIVGALSLSAYLGFLHLGRKTNEQRLKQFTQNPTAQSLLLLASKTRIRLKHLFIILALAGLFIALSRPQKGYYWEELSAKGVDILIALDCSSSMLARDLHPNRLTRAKLAIEGMVNHFQGDRPGLIAFSGSAFLQCPLTFDLDAFRLTLNSMQVGIIPHTGTHLAAAITEAEAAFDKQNNHKVLIILTDGEDHEEQGLEQARQAAQNGLVIYTVGVGSEKGAPIPVEVGGFIRRTDYARDASGNIINTQLKADTLIEIAEVTGGFYRNLADNPTALNDIYEDIAQKIPPEERESTWHRMGIDRFQWVLAGVLLLLMIEPLIQTRGRKHVSTTANTALLVLLALSMTPLDLKASSQAQAAQEAFRSGAYDTAIKTYQEALSKEPNNPTWIYNLGISQYRAGAYKQAQRTFEELLYSGDLAMQAKSFYNLGNIAYRLGEKTLQTDTEATIEQWEAAIKHYENAMELNPNRLTLENQTFVQQRLDQLKAQSQQESSDENNQQEESSDSSSDEDKQQSNSSNADGSQSDSGSSQSGSEGSQDNNSPSESNPQNSDSSSQNQQNTQPSTESSGDQNTGSNPSNTADHQDASSPQKQSADQANQENNQGGSSQQQGQTQQAMPENDPLGENANPTSGERLDEENADAQTSAKEASSGKPETPAEEGKKTTTQVRYIPGMMHPDEAHLLLESMRAHEKQLPFRPQLPAQNSRNHKNW